MAIYNLEVALDQGSFVKHCYMNCGDSNCVDIKNSIYNVEVELFCCCFCFLFFHFYYVVPESGGGGKKTEWTPDPCS